MTYSDEQINLIQETEYSQNGVKSVRLNVLF